MTTRVVYGAYVVLVAAFVVSNIVQVAEALFGGSETNTASTDGRFPKVTAECGALLTQRLDAITKAQLVAVVESNADDARARYSSERGPIQPSELERACTADPHGRDALAAVRRLDRATEAHVVRTTRELSPVRLAAQSFISGHPL